MLRNTGRADRMAARLQTTRGIHRQLAVFAGDPIQNHARALAVRRQAHGFVLEHFGDREAVVGFDKIQVGEPGAGGLQALAPGKRGTLETGRIASRQRQKLIDLGARAPAHRGKLRPWQGLHREHKGSGTIRNE